MNDNFVKLATLTKLSHTPIWGIVYNTNSYQKRAKRWYHISRILWADGKWWELYWHGDPRGRGKNINLVKKFNNDWGGLNLFPGVFSDALPPRKGSELIWSLDTKD